MGMQVAFSCQHPLDRKLRSWSLCKAVLQEVRMQANLRESILASKGHSISIFLSSFQCHFMGLGKFTKCSVICIS